MAVAINKNHLVKVGLFLFISPVFIGLIGILLPAFGIFPGIGSDIDASEPLDNFLSTPGLWRSIWLTLFTGFGASLGSLIFSMILLAGLSSIRSKGFLARISGALIAVPHSTIAIGILFLLAPSGWFLRLVSPEITGFFRPPTWGWVPDPAGWGLIFGLMAKEIPFITLVGIGALATLPVTNLKRVGSSLGYGAAATWAYIILPLVYRQIRLPLAAVLVFSLSVVDMVLILGPTVPPTLAVLVYQGFSDTDLLARLPSSAGAGVLVLLILGGLFIWYVGERICHTILQHYRGTGHRMRRLDHALHPLTIIALLPVVAGALGLVTAGLWSIASSWRFPDTLPASFTLRHWLSSNIATELLFNSLGLALAATTLAIALTLIVLSFTSQKSETAKHALGGTMRFVLLAPLLVPQIGFMFGLQIFLSWFHLDGSWLALIWIHALFILPYSWLIMAPAYNALDRRYLLVATSLGTTPVSGFWRITLPLLSYPLATTILVGIAVSITLYLPTLFVSVGRINTLTLEVVALASGGNRSLTGVVAMQQIFIPLICFALLQLSLFLRFRKFSAMHAGSLH